MFRLGMIHFDAKPTSKTEINENERTAVQWFEQGMKNDDLPSQTRLGILLYHAKGEGIHEGIWLLKDAAKKENFLAKVFLKIITCHKCKRPLRDLFQISFAQDPAQNTSEKNRFFKPSVNKENCRQCASPLNEEDYRKFLQTKAELKLVAGLFNVLDETESF